MSFQKLDEHSWYDAMVRYLSDDIISEDEKIWKLIQDEKDHFKMGRDMIIDKPWFYRKITDNKIPWFKPELHPTLLSGYILNTDI